MLMAAEYVKAFAQRRKGAKENGVQEAIAAVKENEIAREVVDAAFKVHTKLGPGLLESVYEAAMAHELTRRGHGVVRQAPISVPYDDLVLEIGFRADLLIDDLVLVELKSVEHVLPVHHKQTLTYIRLGGKRLGLLINFGSLRIRDGITRIVNVSQTDPKPFAFLRLCATAFLPPGCSVVEGSGAATFATHFGNTSRKAGVARLSTSTLLELERTN